MSSQDPAKLLRSTNPNDRMQGVKMVAQMQNERALRVLVQLSKNDENPEVRAYARKGAKYVARKLDEAGNLDMTHVETQVKIDAIEDEAAPAQAEDVPEGPVDVPPRQLRRAQGYVDEATQHHVNGITGKAVKALSKAIDANPNLRFDEYYKSLATSVTGLSEEDAIHSLVSSKKRQVLIDADRQKQTAASLDGHMAEANKHSWGTLAIDFGILSAIVFLGTFFCVLLVNYTGNLWVNGSATRVEETRADPDAAEEDLEQAFILDAQATALSAILPVFNVMLALALSIGALLMLLATVTTNGFFGHWVARALGGQGTIPYLMYNLISAYQIPMVAIYVLYLVALILAFIVGMPFAIVGIGLAGLGGLILLILSFRLTGRISRAYFGLGFAKAYLTQMIASLPVTIVLVVVFFLIGLLVSVLAAPALEALPPDLLPANLSS